MSDVRQFNQTEIEAAKAWVSADDVNAANAEYYALRAELAALRVVRDAAVAVISASWVKDGGRGYCELCGDPHDRLGRRPCTMPTLGAALLRSAGGWWA